MEQLESDKNYNGMELERELRHCTELQVEITTTRKEVDISRGNVASLEAEVSLQWDFRLKDRDQQFHP